MQNTVQRDSIVTTVKNWFAQQTPDAVEESKHQLVEIGLYLAIGFLTGFLFKKYGHIFFLMILFFLGLVVLEHFQMITLALHWEVIEQITGLKQATVAQGGFPLLFEWVRLNVWVVISFTIGMIFGFKVG